MALLKSPRLAHGSMRMAGALAAAAALHAGAFVLAFGTGGTRESQGAPAGALEVSLVLDAEQACFVPERPAARGAGPQTEPRLAAALPRAGVVSCAGGGAGDPLAGLECGAPPVPADPGVRAVPALAMDGSSLSNGWGNGAGGARGACGAGRGGANGFGVDDPAGGVLAAGPAEGGTGRAPAARQARAAQPPSLHLPGKPAYPHTCRSGECRSGTPCEGAGRYQVSVKAAGACPEALQVLQSAGCARLDESVREYFRRTPLPAAGSFEFAIRFRIQD